MATTKTKAAPKKQSSKFDKKQYLLWYEQMLLIRKFEEKASQLYIQQKIRGFLHLYNGQEAIAVGCQSATKPEDNMITAYRDHAHPIARGMHPKFVMAELYGKKTGCSHGKGGSMHMFDVERRFWGGHGIVGGQIPLGTGLAFAEKYKGTKNITLTFMGDGSVRQGSFHEALNMAMTWKLPVLYIIENNDYAMGTSVERTSNVNDLYKLARAFDMPSKPVNGMDVEEVHKAVAEAADFVRKGNGPMLLEMKTYRYKGHSMSDPRKYRTKEEEEKFIKEDPIGKVLVALQHSNAVTKKELEVIEAKVDKLIAESVQFAEESPFPDASEIYSDVYVQKDYPFIKD